MSVPRKHHYLPQFYLEGFRIEPQQGKKSHIWQMEKAGEQVYYSFFHLPKALLFAKLNRKLRGYWNYYGIRGNSESLSDYFYQVKSILLKWLNRRSQKRSYNWTGFKALLKDFPLVKPRICHAF